MCIKPNNLSILSNFFIWGLEKWDKNTTSCIDLDFAFDETKSFGIWPFEINYDTYYDLSKKTSKVNIS